MHYYKFNIADWSLGTSHLSLEEEAIYFRLINHYYDTEKPIPLETQPVFRRLRFGSNSDIALSILDEFFDKTEKGFLHLRCEEILKEYRKTSSKNKRNGAKGGRPKKDKGCSEGEEKPSGLDMGCQEEPKHNPNQEPLTINQEEHKVTDKSVTVSSAKQELLYRDMQCVNVMYQAILNVAPKTKEPNFRKWADVIRLMREQDDLTHEEIWKTFTWANKDGFWNTNILSPQKLRSQFGRLNAEMNKSSHGANKNERSKSYTGTMSAVDRVRAATGLNEYGEYETDS